MKKLSEKNWASSGIIQLLPLLMIAFVIIGFVAISTEHGQVHISNIKKAVLGESSSGDGEDSSSNVSTTGSSETNTNTDTNLQNDNNNTSDSNSSETEHKTEAENEVENEKEVEVKDGTGEAKVKIHKANDKFSFEQTQANLQVSSNFPLSVNPSTRELTVTTPAGIKTVAVLPQQVIDNMIAQGYITQISGGTPAPTSSPTSTTTANLTGTNGVSLTTANGTLVYQIQGAKNKKLFGVFEIAIPRTLQVSAQNGNLLNVNQTFFSKVLDTISI